MKKLFILLFLSICLNGYSQLRLEKNFIQNFYATCDAEKYSAFVAAQTGHQLMGTGQFKRAANKFARAIEKDSLYCDAYYLLAFSYQKMGELKKSIEFCVKSIELNYQNPSAWTIKGSSFILMNEIEKANECFKKSIKIAPDKIDGYYGIALYHYCKKEYKLSLDMIEQIEKTLPKPVARERKRLKKLREAIQTHI